MTTTDWISLLVGYSVFITAVAVGLYSQVRYFEGNVATWQKIAKDAQDSARSCLKQTEEYRAMCQQALRR